MNHASSRRNSLAVAFCLVLVGCSQTERPIGVHAAKKAYSDRSRGSYKGTEYVVQPGDTLYYIAWITGRDIESIKAKNNLIGSFTLVSGSVLRLPPCTLSSEKGSIFSMDTRNSQAVIARPSYRDEIAAAKKLQEQPPTAPVSVPEDEEFCYFPIEKWVWPVVLNKNCHILEFDKVKCGIDIPGKKGDSVHAAAGGRVVYAGNGLRGYGNLIIIKHNHDYLTAYAHNEILLVVEKQRIVAGQKIAIMGNIGGGSIRLHFQIRYKGKPVNPLLHLPKQGIR